MYKRAYGDVDYPIVHDPTVIYYILYPEKYIQKDVLFLFKFIVQDRRGPMRSVLRQDKRVVLCY